MANEWTHLLTIPWKSVRLGTLVRLGVSLGWDIDDLLVQVRPETLELWRRSDAVAERPPVMVLAGQEALDEWAARPWEVPGQRTAQPMPEPEQPDEPPADGDAAPLDTPLAAFDEAMAAKVEPLPVVDAPPAGFEVFQRPRPGVRVCPKCGRTMETSGAVEVHLKRDHGPRSVACPDCGSVYATEVGMQRHRRSRHEEEAATEPTRFCNQCGREFESVKAARFHEDNHHGDPMALTCDDCGWVFTNRQGLNHHTTMKHGDGGAKPIPHVYQPHR